MNKGNLAQVLHRQNNPLNKLKISADNPLNQNLSEKVHLHKALTSLLPKKFRQNPSFPSKAWRERLQIKALGIWRHQAKDEERYLLVHKVSKRNLKKDNKHVSKNMATSL